MRLTLAKILLLGAGLLALLAPVLALADDGGVAVAVSNLPSSVDEPGGGAMLGALLEAAKGGQWALVVVLCLMLLTFAVRHYGSRIPGKAGELLGSPVASWVVPLVFSTCGTLAAGLSSGAGLSLGAVMGAIAVGLGAGGLIQRPLGAARAAGEAAAGAVTTKADALKVLGKP